MTKPTKWHVCPAKTQISLGICPPWSESSQGTQWLAEDPMFLHADSELIRLGGRPGWSESSLGTQAILLVLSWGGSYFLCGSVVFTPGCFRLSLALLFVLVCFQSCLALWSPCIGEERAGLCASHVIVCFFCTCLICPFSLGVRGWLWLVLVALPGLSSFLKQNIET